MKARVVVEALRESEANCRMLQSVERVLKALLDRALDRGFYGDVGISLNIEDGTIQDVRENIEARHRV